MQLHGWDGQQNAAQTLLLQSLRVNAANTIKQYQTYQHNSTYINIIHLYAQCAGPLPIQWDAPDMSCKNGFAMQQGGPLGPLFISTSPPSAGPDAWYPLSFEPPLSDPPKAAFPRISHDLTKEPQNQGSQDSRTTKCIMSKYKDQQNRHEQTDSHRIIEWLDRPSCKPVSSLR